MNKQELAIAKKIAEIESVELTKQISTVPETGEEVEWYSVSDVSSLAEYEELYDPFNWSILGPLMVKYKVIPDFNFNSAVVVNYDTQLSFEVYSHDESEESMKQAILECIIKSQEA